MHRFGRSSRPDFATFADALLEIEKEYLSYTRQQSAHRVVAEIFFKDLRERFEAEFGDQPCLVRQEIVKEVARRLGRTGDEERLDDLLSHDLNQVRENLGRLSRRLGEPTGDLPFRIRCSVGGRPCTLLFRGPTFWTHGGDYGRLGLSLSVEWSPRDETSLSDSLDFDVSADDVTQAELQPRERARTRVLHIVRSFGQEAAPERRDDMLLEAAEISWQLLTFDPALAREVSTALSKGTTIADLLSPLCTISVGDDLDEFALARLLRILTRIELLGARGAEAAELLRYRSLAHIAQVQKRVLATSAALECLQTLAEHRTFIWNVFFVDLHLRHICGYGRLPSAALSIVLNASAWYREAEPGDPLPALWQILSDPLDALGRFTFPDLIDSLHGIAGRARTSAEARWCVLALERMIPLYAGDEDDLAIRSVLVKLYDKFSDSLRAKS
jgi:hypothetical protein